MDKSSITWTEGSDWWLSRTTMGGKERYPKQIRVGDLDRPRVYYPINREELLEEVKELERCARYFDLDFDEDEPLRDRLKEAAEDFAGCASRIREACGVVDAG